MSTTLTEMLASYAPTFIIRRLATDPTLITEPTAETFPAAVLFADISGFTPLTEHLAQRGPEGAEELTLLLNRYFSRLIDLITAHGGDIVKFAGDALIVLWSAVAGAFDEASLQEVTLRAAQCSLAVQAELNAYQVTEAIRLSLKLTIGAGQVLMAQLGGVYSRWELLLAGKPLIEVGLADGLTQPGEVILAPAAWKLVPAGGIGQPLQGGYVRLMALPFAPPPRPLARPSLTPAAETALRAYLPGAILTRLSAGQNGWLAELRRVTVIFLNLPDLTFSTPLGQAQQIIHALQVALYHYEGSVNKISVDDKGASLVAALGLPPLAHEDDAVRGVQAALAMGAALREMGLHSAIGVTSGPVFCGSLGNERQCEYTMIGDVVNLAARLMQAAGNPPSQSVSQGGMGQGIPILCDEATYQATKNQITFATLPPIFVKGKADPIPIYWPTASLPQAKSQKPQAKRELVGRREEKMALVAGFQTLLRGGAKTAVILEGEAGIGKSRLVEEALRQAELLGVASLLGVGDVFETATPYYAWRPVFRQLFRLDPQPTAVQRTELLAPLEAEPALPRLAPLLNAVLPLNFPENDLTAQMRGDARADHTRDLLARLLQASVSQAPALLIIEDAHWLDSASWSLLRQVSQAVQHLYLLIVTCPMPEPVPAEYIYLRDAPETNHLRLAALPSERL